MRIKIRSGAGERKILQGPEITGWRIIQCRGEPGIIAALQAFVKTILRDEAGFGTGEHITRVGDEIGRKALRIPDAHLINAPVKICFVGAGCRRINSADGQRRTRMGAKGAGYSTQKVSVYVYVGIGAVIPEGPVMPDAGGG